MRHAVVVEVGGGCESLAAHGALVRLFAAVDAPVGVERTRRRKALAAHVAHVRLLACSFQNMCLFISIFIRHFLRDFL